MPEESLAEISKHLFDLVVVGNIAGYFLCIVTLIASLAGYRTQRKIFTKEINRISKEKEKLQKRLLEANQIESSEE